MNTKNKKQQVYPDAEERLRKALERLGTDDPKCAHCGEPNPLLLELHHIAGKQYGEDTIIECVKCHKLLSDAQYDHPPRIDDKRPTKFERIGHLLLGLADVLRFVASKLDEIGRALIEYVTDTKRSAGEGGASC